MPRGPSAVSNFAAGSDNIGNPNGMAMQAFQHGTRRPSEARSSLFLVPAFRHVQRL